MSKDHDYSVAHRTNALSCFVGKAAENCCSKEKQWRIRIVLSTHVALDCCNKSVATAALREGEVSEAFVKLANEQSATQNEASTSSAPRAETSKSDG